MLGQSNTGNYLIPYIGHRDFYFTIHGLYLISQTLQIGYAPLGLVDRPDTETDLILLVVLCCNPMLVTTSPRVAQRWNYGRAHPAPCVRPRCVCSVFACPCIQ